VPLDFPKRDFFLPEFHPLHQTTIASIQDRLRCANCDTLILRMHQVDESLTGFLFVRRFVQRTFERLRRTMRRYRMMLMHAGVALGTIRVKAAGLCG
jgi:hypothetical protein